MLDHRISQLTKEKGPIAEHIDKLEAHIRNMYEELVNEFAAKKSTDRILNNKELKIEAQHNEVTKLRVSVREKERKIFSICHDIESCVKLTDPKDCLLYTSPSPRDRG